MIHALIYARRDGSYGFYESTPGFPAEYRDAIAAICDNAEIVSIPEMYRTALRYAPLGRKYLLTVIFRNVAGKQDAALYHWNFVNYLMDGADADRFFRLPFRAAEANALQVSQNLLDNFRGCTLPADLGQYLFRPGAGESRQVTARISPAALMAGALYARKRPLESQLFIQLPDDPGSEIYALLDSLPPRLRREISFHTCVLFSRESHGVAICCCPAPILDRILTDGFGGCEMTQKYYHFFPDARGADRQDKRYLPLTQKLLKLPRALPLYHFLQHAIPSWEVYQRLAAVTEERNPLQQALKIIPEANLLELLPMTESLSLEQLQLLHRASARGSTLRKELSALVRSRGGGWLSRAKNCLQHGIPGWWQLLLFLAAAAGIIALQMGSVSLIPMPFPEAEGIWIDMQYVPELAESIGSVILAFAAGFFLRGAIGPRRDP